MEIISFINEPIVIRKILEHLDLWRIPEQPRPSTENRFVPSQHYLCPGITEQDDFDFFDDGAGQVTRNHISTVIDGLIHVTPPFIFNPAPYYEIRSDQKISDYPQSSATFRSRYGWAVS